MLTSELDAASVPEKAHPAITVKKMRDSTSSMTGSEAERSFSLARCLRGERLASAGISKLPCADARPT
jgi:hypothetical protein